jgi:hypothetical protein
MHAVETTVADVLGKLLVVGITDPGIYINKNYWAKPSFHSSLRC